MWTPSRRGKIITVAILAALLGAAVPILVSVYLASRLAQREMMSTLSFYAQVPLSRAKQAFEEASAALQEVGGYADCSADHIEQMRNLAMRYAYVEEVGYFEDDLLRCSSWGTITDVIHRAPADFTTPEGLSVTGNLVPTLTRSGAVIVIHSDSHNVLVSQSRLIGLSLVQDISLALAYRPEGADPVILAGGGTVAGPRLRTLLGGAEPGTWKQPEYVMENGRFVALATSAFTQRGTIYSGFLIWSLPIGVALAALIVANVVWLSRRQLDLQHEIWSAIRHNQLTLLYQPVMDLVDGTCIGAEALIRWPRGDGQYVRPALFIAVAEERGMIGRITDFALRRVAEDMGDLLRADPSVHIAVNLAASDISSGRIVARIADELQRHAIPPAGLWLEVTERVLIEPDTSRRVFEQLRQAGHTVAIDDFGTGYSSLKYLQTLPLDALKIDKIFVDAVGMETAVTPVVDHIISLANSLGLFIVAEGIETKEQLDYLVARGVGTGQGYYFSEPLEPAAFREFHRKHRKRLAG